MRLGDVPVDCVGRLIRFLDRDARCAFRASCRALSEVRSLATTVCVSARPGRALALPAWVANARSVDRLVVHGEPSPAQLCELARAFSPKRQVQLRCENLAVAYAALLLWPEPDVVTSAPATGPFGWGPASPAVVCPRLRAYEMRVTGDSAEDARTAFAAVRAWRPLRLLVSRPDPAAIGLARDDERELFVDLTGPASLPLALDPELRARVVYVSASALETEALALGLWGLLARQQERGCALCVGHAADWALLERGRLRSGECAARLAVAVRRLRCTDTPPRGWVARCLPGLRKLCMRGCSASDGASLEDLGGRLRAVRGCWCLAALDALAAGASQRAASLPPLRVRFALCEPVCCLRLGRPCAARRDGDPRWAAAFLAHPRVSVLL